MVAVPTAGLESTEAEFADFVTARSVVLWRSAWLLTGDSHKAEDLVQAALAKTWPHWRRVSADDDPEHYVRRVMYTTYATWWRHRWTAEVPTEQLPDSGAAAQQPDATSVDVTAALAQLPYGQRAVVVLRYFEDQTEVETAGMLGISVDTVKSQAARALRTLRNSPLLR